MKNSNKSILLAKFNIPKLASDHIRRSLLIDRLNDESKLALISASSGYGKSSLVADWLSDTDQTNIWYNLDKSDDDFYQFYQNFILSINNQISGFSLDLEEKLHVAESLGHLELSHDLINELQKIKNPINLVLDDYHLITHEHIHELIMLIIKFSHKGIRLIIITRYDPPFPLIEWRSKRIMIDVRSNDLKFNPTEINQLLGNSLGETNEIINTKVEKLTDGWISGIRLLTYGVRNPLEITEKINQLVESKASYFHTLIYQTLNQHTPKIKEIVLQLSFLQSFSLELLNHISNSKLGDKVIQELRSSNLFIVELDGRQDWFRYHHIFQELLIIEAQEYFKKSEIKIFYLKIANWHEKKGLSQRAIEYYLLGGGFEKALEIFAELRISLLNSGDWTELHTIYNLFKNEQIKTISLRLTNLMLLLHQGKTMRLFELSTQIEKELIDTNDNSEVFIQYRAELYTMLAYKNYQLERNYERCIEQCKYVLKNLRSDFIYPRGYAWLFLINSYQVKGQIKKAEKIAFDQIEVCSSEWECSQIWFALCFMYNVQNELDKLKIIAQKLINFGLEKNRKEAIANGYFFLGEESYSRGKWQKSIEYVDKSREMGAFTIGAIRIFSTLIKAGALEKIGQLDQMKNLLEELKEKNFLKGNSLVMLYVIGYEAEMSLLSGDMSLAKKLVDQIPEIPLMPSTITTIPHFGVIKYNIYSKNFAKVEDLLPQFENFLVSLNNNRFLIDIICMRAMLAFQKGEREIAYEQLHRALLKAQSNNVISPFINGGDIVEKILFQLPINHEIDQRFLDLVKAKFSERNEYHFNIQLSSRELDIIRLFTKKMTNREIGQKLFISEKTVKNHSNTIFKKLRIKNRREAVQKALNLKLLG